MFRFIGSNLTTQSSSWHKFCTTFQKWFKKFLVTRLTYRYYGFIINFNTLDFCIWPFSIFIIVILDILPNMSNFCFHWIYSSSIAVSFWNCFHLNQITSDHSFLKKKCIFLKYTFKSFLQNFPIPNHLLQNSGRIYYWIAKWPGIKLLGIVSLELWFIQNKTFYLYPNFLKFHEFNSVVFFYVYFSTKMS